MERIELKIGGMSCGHCTAAVQKALAKVPGLSVADVAVGSATVEVEDAAAIGLAAKQAVEDAGFHVESIRPAARTSAAAKSSGGCCCGGGKCG